MEESAIRDVFAERLVDRGLAEETARSIAAQLKPCVLLTLRYGWRPWKSRRGASRFGGWPDVPQNFAWPHSQYQERWGTRPNGERYQLREKSSNPLTFVAQLNLAEIHPHLPGAGLLPQRGLLSIFFDRHEMPLGDDPDDPSGWGVFWFEDVASLTHRQAPPHASAPLKNCPIRPQRWISLPADLTPVVLKDDLMDQHWSAILEEAQKLDLDGSVYRMFGHPGVLREAMEPEAERIRRGLSKEAVASWSAEATSAFDAESRADWRLLIQFPTDFRAKIDWCQAGTLFVWIRNEDLAARRFDKAWTTWQVG